MTNTRLQALGQQLGFVIVLAGLTELVWHQPQVHPLVSVLGYLVFGLLLFDFIHFNQAFHPVRGLLIAGLFGILQATLISGNLGSDFPLGVALYGASISTLAFFVAYLIFFQPLRWGLGGIFSTGLLSGLWVYGVPQTDLIDIAWQAPDLMPTLMLATLILGLGLGLKLIGQKSNYAPMPLMLTRPALILVILSSVGLAIVQFSQDNLTTVSLLIALVVMVVLILMLWFIYLNKLYSRAQATPALTWLQIGFIVLAFLIAHGLGYIAVDAVPELGDGIILVLLILGASWLPLMSAALGFEAFVQLADEGIL